MLLQPITWLIIAFFIFLLYLIFGGGTYINCTQPVKGYINIFRNSKGTIVKPNLIFYLSFPMALSIATVLYKALNDSLINIICLMISILTAMLYSFMAILSTKKDYLNSNEEIAANTFERQVILQEETINIIAFEILISIIILILCFIQPIFNDLTFAIHIGIHVINLSKLNSVVVYFLLYQFLLNLLMVSKRFYEILKDI